ncbi:MAG: hypothetical protein AB7L84_16305 [Acidimicrobiia bacterium]
MARRVLRAIAWSTVVGLLVAALRAWLLRGAPPPAGTRATPWPPLDVPADTPGGTGVDSAPDDEDTATSGDAGTDEDTAVDRAAGADHAGDDGHDEDAAGTEAPGTWVEPAGGDCPGSHPVKVKVASGIFHVPGGASYERTRADRCYCDAAAAEADGWRAARR